MDTRNDRRGFNFAAYGQKTYVSFGGPKCR